MAYTRQTQDALERLDQALASLRGLIKRCKKEWCRIKTGNYKGWTLKKFLWGRI